MKKSYKNIVLISTFLFIGSTSYAYAADVECDEYFDLKTGNLIKKKKLPDDLKQLGDLLLCDIVEKSKTKKQLVSHTSVKSLEDIKKELQNEPPNKIEIDRLKKDKNLEPIFLNSMSNKNYNKILNTIFKEINSKLDPKPTGTLQSKIVANISNKDNKSNNGENTVSGSTPTSNWNITNILIAFLAILGLLISCLSLFINFRNKILMDNLKTLIGTKVSNASMTIYMSQIKDHLSKSDTDINKIKNDIKRIESLVKKIEDSSKNKSVIIEKPSSDNPNLSSRFMNSPKIEFKPKTFEEELIEKFNNISFRNFYEENKGKVIGIINGQDMLIDNSIKPKFKDEEQGKYCIIPSESEPNNFYLFPKRSSDIKVDAMSKNIFQFTTNTENATYALWNINKPAIVNFNSDSYKVIKHGRIDIQG